MTVIAERRRQSSPAGALALGFLLGVAVGMWSAVFVYMMAPVEPEPEPEKYELECLTMPVDNPYVRCK